MTDWTYELEDLEDDPDGDPDALEPEPVSLENALFLLLGVAIALATIVWLAS